MAVDDDFPVPPGTLKVDPDDDGGSRPDNVVPMERPRQRRTSPAAAREKKLREAEDILNDLQADAIGLLAAPAPVSAGTWAIYSDANTRAVLRLASSRPGLLKAILGSGDFAAFFALGTFVAAMLVSVGVELGRIEGDGMIAERLKVAEAFDAVMEELEREQPSGNATDNGAGAGRSLSLPGLLGDSTAAPSP